ncbi:MAG: nucleotidyltransferase family protein [Bacteroidia bacterium]
MDKQEILDTLKAEKPYLSEHFGLEEIALFGSFTRNAANENSDIDLLVSLKKPSYSSLMGLYIYLEKKLNNKIDITRKGAHLSQRFMQHINKDLIYV